MIKKLRALLPGQSFGRSTAVLVGGTAVGQILAVLASPVLTRIYLPEDFGVQSIYFSVISMLVGLGALQLEKALPLSDTDDEARHLLLLCLGVLAAMISLSILGVYLGGGLLIEQTGAAGLKPHLWLIPVGLAGAAAYQVLNYWAIRIRSYKIIARTRISQAVTRLLVQLGVGLAWLGPAGLLLGDIAGRVSGIGVLTMLVYRERGDKFSPTLRGLLEAGRKYRKFAVVSSGSAILNNTVLYLPALLVANFYGVKTAGFFALAVSVIGMPVGLLVHAVAQVFTGEGAELARRDFAEFRKLFWKTARNLSFLGAAPALVLLVMGPWLFSLVFGEQWWQAGVYARLMSVMLMAMFVVSPLAYTLAVLEKQHLLLRCQILRFILALGGLCGVASTGGSEVVAIAVYSGGMTVSYVALFVTCVIQLRRPREAPVSGIRKGHLLP